MTVVTKKIAVIKPYRVSYTFSVTKVYLFKDINTPICEIFKNILRKYEAEILKRIFFGAEKLLTHYN